MRRKRKSRRRKRWQHKAAELAARDERIAELEKVVEQCLAKLHREMQDRPHLVDRRMVAQLFASFLRGSARFRQLANDETRSFATFQIFRKLVADWTATKRLALDCLVNSSSSLSFPLSALSETSGENKL